MATTLVVALVVAGGIFGLIVGGLSCLVNAAEERADAGCTELCDALGHKKVKMTDLGCVCKDPDSDERKVYAGPLEVAQ